MTHALATARLGYKSSVLRWAASGALLVAGVIGGVSAVGDTMHNSVFSADVTTVGTPTKTHLKYIYDYPNVDFSQNVLLALAAGCSGAVGAYGIARGMGESKGRQAGVLGIGGGVGAAATILLGSIAIAGSYSVPVGSDVDQGWTKQYYSQAQTLPSFYEDYNGGSPTYTTNTFTLEDKAKVKHFFKIAAIHVKGKLGADVAEVDAATYNELSAAYKKATAR